MHSIAVLMVIIGVVSFFLNTEPTEKWDTLILALIGVILFLITL